MPGGGMEEGVLQAHAVLRKYNSYISQDDSQLDENARKETIPRYVKLVEEKYGLSLSQKDARLYELKEQMEELERELEEKSREVKSVRKLTEENRLLVDDCSDFYKRLCPSDQTTDNEDSPSSRNNKLSSSSSEEEVGEDRTRKCRWRRKSSKLDQLRILLEETEGKVKVLILGDSHARNMQCVLEELLGPDYSISSIFKPNATLPEILQDAESLSHAHTSRDFVLVLGGINGIDDITPFEHSLMTACRTLYRVSQSTNVIFNHIPFRYDCRFINYFIRIANSIIDDCLNEEYSSRSLHLVSVKFKRSLHYTKHGLNLNYTGKKFLAQHLTNIIKNKSQSNSVLRSI